MSSRNFVWDPILKEWVAEIQTTYTTRMDYLLGSDSKYYLLYFGRAIVGSVESSPVWKIIKFTYDGNNNITSMIYPNGLDTYAFQWSNRTGYTYS